MADFQTTASDAFKLYASSVHPSGTSARRTFEDRQTFMAGALWVLESIACLETLPERTVRANRLLTELREFSAQTGAALDALN